MSAPKDGGPAFPAAGMYAWNEATQQADHLPPSQGMSLRDHFAGQALPLLAGRAWDHVGDDQAILKTWARTAYQIADAMLAERAKGSGE